MSMRFMAGMGGYNTAQILRRWSSNTGGAVNATGGRRGGPSMRFTDWLSTLTKLIDPQSTWIIGFAFKCSALPASTRRGIMGLNQNGVGTVCSISVNSDGTISAHRDWPPGGVVLATSTAKITAGTYAYIEVKFVIHDTAGSIEVRKDGATILLVTNVDTQQTATAFADLIIFPNTNGSEAVTLDYDDMYVCDASGTFNNNFLGDIRIDTTFPNGAGNSSQWLPSAGSNYQNVDDDPSNDDTDYNIGSVVGVKDTYAFPDITPTAGNVVAVATNITVRKDDASAHSVRDVIRRSAADYGGNTIALTNSYAMLTQIHETDPSTSAAWTIANINAAEFGVELVS